MKILHIDRSMFFQKVVKKSSEFEGAEITGCTSMAEAWDLLRSAKVDLILTGQELDDGSTDNFLKEIALSPYRDIPVIVLSSSDTLEIRQHYFELGVIDFISKNDFTVKKLRSHIENILKLDSLTDKLRDASIAVVDDSRFILKVVRNILGLHRITNLDLYDDPRELVESGKKYDIYLVDMVLPHISGRQLIMNIREENPVAVIIVISSLESYSTVLHALQSGADDYIIKPFDAGLLTARLKSSFRNFLIMKELEEKRRQMEILAVTDFLTGASSRRAILDRLEREIIRSRETGLPLSVLLLDIDKFKRINDNYGHGNGDLVLKSLADLFRRNCDGNCAFGRYGGEEFLFLMPRIGLAEAREKGESLREQFSLISYPDIDPGLRLTFSGGLVQWSGETGTEILRQADLLLYEAKEGGRNNIRD